jgi:putative membrane protein
MAEVDPRVLYAAERTMLAWVRTGLAMMGFGFVVARFSLLLKELIHAEHSALLERPGISLWLGTILVSLGVCVNVAASFKYARDVRALQENRPLVSSTWSFGRIVSLVLAALGILMVASLVSLGF